MISKINFVTLSCFVWLIQHARLLAGKLIKISYLATASFQASHLIQMVSFLYSQLTVINKSSHQFNLLQTPLFQGFGHMLGSVCLGL